MAETDADTQPVNPNWLWLRLDVCNHSLYDKNGRVQLPPDEAQAVRNEIGALTQQIRRAQVHQEND